MRTLVASDEPERPPAWVVTLTPASNTTTATTVTRFQFVAEEEDVVQPYRTTAHVGRPVREIDGG